MKLYYDQSQDKVRNLPDIKHHDLEDAKMNKFVEIVKKNYTIY